MSHSVTFLIIVLAIVLAVVVSQYFHKRHGEYKLDDIQKAVSLAYPKGVASVQMDTLVGVVKKYFHCSAKEAHYIIGVARRKNLIDIGGDYVSIL